MLDIVLVTETRTLSERNKVFTPQILVEETNIN